MRAVRTSLRIHRFTSAAKMHSFIFRIMLRSEEIRSPLGARAGSSLYDKLNLLSEEISEGVVNLSSEQRFVIEGDLQRLKEEANREVSPEAVYNLLLFRKYSEIANRIRDEKVELQRTVTSLSEESMFDVGSGTIDGQKEAKLAGFEAIKANLFWLRVLAAMFSFISFIVMSFVPYVNQSSYYPSEGLDSQCTSYISKGAFNMRPYQFVIGMGVLIYIHTLITSMYYLLPVDDDNQKYIPGFRSLMQLWCNDEQQTEELMTTLGAFVRTVVRFLEFTADLTIVVLSIIAFILAAIALEQPASFVQTYYQQDPYVYVSFGVYYNLEAYFQTFSHMSPPCLDDEDPVSKIRASLAMFFFALAVMFVCLQVSWRAMKQEFTHRTPPSGHTASDIGNRGVHTFEGREAFLAQPLPTSEEEEGDSAGSDEEVAVEFHRTPPRPSHAAATAITTRSSAVELSSRPPSTAASEDTNRINARGAAMMRNHEAQRFAATDNRNTPSAPPPPPLSSSSTSNPTTQASRGRDSDRAEQLDRAVAAQEAGGESHSESEAEFEEADL